jgi:hypothetical protein
MALTEEQKEKALNNIGRIDVDVLKKYITDGDITLQEMKETHALDHRKIQELEPIEKRRQQEAEDWSKANAEDTVEAYDRYLRDHPDGPHADAAGLRMTRLKEQGSWNQARNTETVDSYLKYLKLYPEGQYADEARSKIEIIKSSIEADKARLLQDMKNNPQDYSPAYLKNEILGKGKLSKQDLFNEGIITPEALKVYLDPPPFLSGDDQNTWKNLKPIPEGNNDVYIFGIPRSGKSCILAGMLYQADKEGKSSLDVENALGTKYAHDLIRGVELGYVPPPTSEDQVNYVGCDFYMNDYEYSLSIVEMSGEFFNRTYENDSISGEDTIGARGFLQNDNPKTILLVIDYDRDINGISYQASAKPGQILSYVLKKMEKDGTLEHTNSIQIVVTKTDLMPQDRDRNEYTREFLNENYRAFINEVKRLNKKFDINRTRDHKAIIHPFSLGEFMLAKTFQFDPTDSANLLNSILKMSKPNRKMRFWEKLFNL